MRLNISRAYDSTADLYDWANFPDTGLDQYRPIFNNKGQVKVYIAVDPASGSMFLEVPELFDVQGRAMIVNPKSRNGDILCEPDVALGASFPVPQINAYGQVYAYRYRLIESGALD